MTWGVYGDSSPTKRSHIGLLCSSNLTNSFSPQGLSLYGSLCQAHPSSLYNTSKSISTSSSWTLLKCHLLERPSLTLSRVASLLCPISFHFSP